MSSPQTSLDALSAEATDLAEVGRYDTPTAAAAHGLVVLAMGHPYWIATESEDHRLLVEPEIAELAREQLRRFDEESQRWPPRGIADPASRHPLDLAGPMVWAAALLTLFREQTRRTDWLEAGALDPNAIFGQGEWWRTVTALFLHADIGHVLANALTGIFVFGAVLATFGRARGWLLLAASAVLGNFAVAVIHFSDTYRSIGASTAVFAGIGLLTGRAVWWALRAEHPHFWRTMAIPLMAGTTTLGLFGAGGIQVDVLAHVLGFTSGVGLGIFAGVFGGRAQPRQHTAG